MTSILRYEKCPQCHGVIATQVYDRPITRYDEDHVHEDGAPSTFGHLVKEKANG